MGDSGLSEILSCTRPKSVEPKRPLDDVAYSISGTFLSGFSLFLCLVRPRIPSENQTAKLLDRIFEFNNRQNAASSFCHRFSTGLIPGCAEHRLGHGADTGCKTEHTPRPLAGAMVDGDVYRSWRIFGHATSLPVRTGFG